MPAAKPEEFRRRAVALARSGEKPVAEISKDLGISESCLRRWMAQSNVDDGHLEGLTRDDRAELVRRRASWSSVRRSCPSYRTPPQTPQVLPFHH
jgi:transposase